MYDKVSHDKRVPPLGVPGVIQAATKAESDLSSLIDSIDECTAEDFATKSTEGEALVKGLRKQLKS